MLRVVVTALASAALAVGVQPHEAPALGFSFTNVAREAGLNHTTVFGGETGIGRAQKGGVATVTPTGVSCTGTAKAVLLAPNSKRQKC